MLERQCGAGEELQVRGQGARLLQHQPALCWLEASSPRAQSQGTPRWRGGFGRALGLHKTRHFTLGNKKLNVPLDHKPLLKFLGYRELGDIENPMILNLKEKTLCWRFSMEQVPGKDHHVANAMSWFPEKEPVIDDSWRPWGTSR